MITNKWAILIVVFSTLLTSIGQVLFKFGSGTAGLNLGLLTNYYIVFGLVVYGFSALLLVIALKHGELSVLYPIVATSYIWVSLLSIYFFGESLNFFKGVGIVVIIFGVSFIGVGGRKNAH